MNQRQLVDRRAVLLVWRTQNREVHQIDRRIGLQQIAPDAFARMRFAGHQQHPQAIAYAVDDHRRAVVLKRLFRRSGRGFELDDIFATMSHRHGDGGVLADRHVALALILAVDAQ